jgi:hypothetical protein
MSKKPLRFAVVGPGRSSGVGAGRGRVFINSSAAMPSQIQLVAICDLDQGTCAQWEERGDVRVYQDYSKLLEADDIDAVCISTPVNYHAKQSLEALNAGKHVLSEVPSAYSLEECYALVEAVERTGLVYMLAENYCFRREVMMVDEMVKRGVFGDLISTEGNYVHDTRDLHFDTNGELTWRGKLQFTHRGNFYPTHSFGPMCKWLDINHSDRLKTLAAFTSPSLSGADYVKRNMGADHPLADAEKWVRPNLVTVIFNTEKGVLGEHKLDGLSPRPHDMTQYALQGTRASFMTNIKESASPLVWIQDRSSTSATGVARDWDELWKYADEYEHPLWRDFGEQALKAGHGGSDFFILREFCAAVAENRPPVIDVYDAVTWSSVSPLSTQSIETGNMPVAIPNFKLRGSISLRIRCG